MTFTNPRYCIPFNELGNEIPQHRENYDMFMADVFSFKESVQESETNVTEVHVHIMRKDFANADRSMCVDNLSDCAMELLAEKVKNAPDMFGIIRVKSNDERNQAIYRVAERILHTQFDVPYDDELDKQIIEPMTRCFNRETLSYVTYFGKIPEALVQDGKQAIVIDEDTKDVHATQMCNLIKQY
jgi:hypothetical protein